MLFHRKLSDNYGIEIELFKLFKFSSFQLFSLNCDFSLSEKLSHCPYFFFILTLLNVKIIEFSIYSLDHKKNAQKKESNSTDMQYISAIDTEDIDFV
jgi:hypothetical protein